MKKIITIFIAACILTSCSKKPQFDCGCETLVSNDNEKKPFAKYIAGGQTASTLIEMTKKPFTGTCATFTDDRAKEILGLYTFENGYRTKSISYKMLDTVKLQTRELTYDDKDVATGWEKNYKIVGNENVQTYEIIYDGKNAPTGWDKDYKMVGTEKMQTKDIKFSGDKKDGWELEIGEIKDDTKEHLYFANVDEYKEYTNSTVSYSYKLGFEEIGEYNVLFGTIDKKSCVYLLKNGPGGDAEFLCKSDVQYYTNSDIEKTKDFFECVKSKNLKGFWYKYYPKQ
jgi:hypothetical protein